MRAACACDQKDWVTCDGSASLTAGNCEVCCCPGWQCVLIAEAIVPFDSSSSWDGCSVRSCCSSGTERRSLAETALCSSTKASMSLSASVCRSTVPLRPLPLESALEGSIPPQGTSALPLSSPVRHCSITFYVAFLPCAASWHLLVRQAQPPVSCSVVAVVAVVAASAVMGQWCSIELRWRPSALFCL